MRELIAGGLLWLAECIAPTSYEEEVVVMRHTATTSTEMLRVRIVGDDYGMGIKSVFNAFNVPEFEVRWTSGKEDREVLQGGWHES